MMGTAASRELARRSIAGALTLLRVADADETWFLICIGSRRNNCDAVAVAVERAARRAVALEMPRSCRRMPPNSRCFTV